MDLEKERGITIKAHALRLNYKAEDGLKLYPENQELKNLRKTILVEAFIEVFKNLKKSEKLCSNINLQR